MAKPQIMSTKDVAAAFGVDPVTVYNWRQGSAKRPPLPTAEPASSDGRCKVVFKRSDVKAWTKAHGIVPKGGAKGLQAAT